MFHNFLIFFSFQKVKKTEYFKQIGNQPQGNTGKEKKLNPHMSFSKNSQYDFVLFPFSTHFTKHKI